MTIVLASTSPVRRQLLERAGLSIDVVKPPLDEERKKRELAHLSPRGLAHELAMAKALSIEDREAGAIIVGADQVLEFEDTRLDKPETMAEARQQLLRLRGKTHTLISAIACVKDSSLVWSHVAIAELDMRDFSDRFLDDYLERIGLDATQSVGAYKLESIGSQLFESVRGDYFTVLGLPLLPLLGFFRGSGVLPA